VGVVAPQAHGRLGHAARSIRSADCSTILRARRMPWISQ
jgi:hypothetical protein